MRLVKWIDNDLKSFEANICGRTPLILISFNLICHVLVCSLPDLNSSECVSCMR